MQMLGQPLYEATGVKNAKAAFKGDYKDLPKPRPTALWTTGCSASAAARTGRPAAARAGREGRRFMVTLRAAWEVEGVLQGLSARWIDPSYGGDPIRNPDAPHTGRNMYGFDPRASPRAPPMKQARRRCRR